MSQKILQPIKNEAKSFKKFAGNTVKNAVHAAENVLHANKKRATKPTQKHTNVQRVGKSAYIIKDNHKSKFKKSTHMASMAQNMSISRSGYFVNDSDPHQRFKVKCEKVGDIVGNNTGTSVIQTFSLTPANTTMFPIFSNNAVTYQKWKPYYMKFHFITEMYNVSNQVTAGKVVMAVQYDPDQAITGLTDTQLELQSGAVAGAPFTKNLCLDVMKNRPRTDRELTYYVDSNNSTELRGAMLGYLIVCVINTAATNAQLIGELYVEYGFDMYRPGFIPANLALLPFMDARYTTGIVGTNMFTGSYNAGTWNQGTRPLISDTQAIVLMAPRSWTTVNNNVYFPDDPAVNGQVFFVILEVSSLAANLTWSSTLPTANNLTGVNTFKNRTSYTVTTADAVSGSAAYVRCETCVKVSNNGPSSSGLPLAYLSYANFVGGTYTAVSLTVIPTSFQDNTIGTLSEKRMATLLESYGLQQPEKCIKMPRHLTHPRALESQDADTDLSVSSSSSDSSQSSCSRSNQAPGYRDTIDDYHSSVSDGDRIYPLQRSAGIFSGSLHKSRSHK